MSAPPPPPNPPKVPQKPKIEKQINHGEEITRGLKLAFDRSQKPVVDSNFNLQAKEASRKKLTEVGNTGHERLTYESVFNHPHFRHTNECRYMASYSIPLDNVNIILGEQLTKECLEALRKAFFPAMPNTEALRNSAWKPWVNIGVDPKNAYRIAKPAGKVYMPYNPI